MMIFGFAVSLLIMLQRRVRENAHKRISSEQVPAAQADSGEQNSEN